MTKRLVTVGDLVVDVQLNARLPITANAHQTSPSMLIEPGGACSTIFAARNLGLHVTALGTVGADLQGRMLLDMMTDAGVDLSALVLPTNSATTTVISLVDKRAGHAFIGHYGTGPAIEMTNAAREQLHHADALFIPGYSLVDERLRPLMNDVLHIAAGGQCPLYVDAGPFMGQLEPERIADVLRLTDVLLLTEEEIPSVAAGAKGIDACRALSAAYPHLLIALKLGEHGCHVISPDLDLPCPGFAVELVDAIGAGDAFAGAFIWARLSGYRLEDCATIANAMGAASVAKTGAGRNVPTRSEVQYILNANQTGLLLPC